MYFIKSNIIKTNNYYNTNGVGLFQLKIRNIYEISLTIILNYLTLYFNFIYAEIVFEIIT